MTAIRHDPFPVGEAFHGIYAHGVETSADARTLYISGQVGPAPNGALAPDFTGQCRQALINLRSVLASADMDFSDIVKTTFFLTRREDLDDLIKVRKEFLDGVRPANTTVFVSGLVSPDWLIEIEAVATKS